VADGAQRTQFGAEFEAGARHEPRSADPCALVLFGATGDLASRLVVPALYNLSHAGLLPEDFALIGVARAAGTANGWRAKLLVALKAYIGADLIDEAAWTRLADRMSYVSGDLSQPELHQALKVALDDAAKTNGTGGNAIFYLAVADELFGAAIEQLGKATLTDQPEIEDGRRRYWRRVVIEKPFGHSLGSAQVLNRAVARTLSEDQIFRIDHFLGKETVQNILAFRFANGMFEPLWNRDRIDQVQITAAETVGVETRGQFYEATGALRDMAANHALSLISMVAMEPPTSFGGDAIRAKKTEVFAAMPALHPAQAVRGQYGPGEIAGKQVKGYRSETDVAGDSNVETYVALKFEIDSWRWAGVPFYFRTGKHMAERTTEIAICFKPSAYAAFRAPPVEAIQANWLVLHIGPDEGIVLEFVAKRPGPVINLAPVKMDFRYDDSFERQLNVGYETLIYDVMIGDQTLFMSAEMVEQGWRIVQPVLDDWAATKADFPNYRSGDEGPAAADGLLAADESRTWRPLHPQSSQEPPSPPTGPRPGCG
jgi:glucose-6-phosphate 1-dehydrogenase